MTQQFLIAVYHKAESLVPSSSAHTPVTSRACSCVTQSGFICTPTTSKRMPVATSAMSTTSVADYQRVLERHCSLVCVSSVAAKLCQNGSDMVWLACKPVKANHVRPLSHSQQRQHFSCSFSPRLRRYTGRRTEHEAVCQQQQRSKNLLLPSSPSTPGSPPFCDTPAIRPLLWLTYGALISV